MRIRVKPSADANGVTRLIPKGHRVVIRRVKDEDWPRGAIARDGEALPESPYLRRLIKAGEVLLCEPVVELAPAPQIADPPKPPRVRATREAPSED